MPEIKSVLDITVITIITAGNLSRISSASGTETVAVPLTDGSYKLHGFKWFTSATDADVTLTLARVQDRRGTTTPVQQVS